uniref:Mitotic spindle assembly checkpoint protein MAD1 n=1 Tax=Steinernema glaseri TaxID=37863 RepID=A0A1I7YVL5_9BILA
MDLSEPSNTINLLDEWKFSDDESLRGLPMTPTGTIDYSSVPLIADKLMTEVLTKDLNYARQNITYFAKKALDLMKERNAALISVEQMKAKVKVLENQNKSIRESAVRMQARVEQEEEYISNMLLKRIQKLKNDKESLALMYEQEEEYLTNDLTRKLSQLESERNELAARLAQEQNWVESNLLEKIRRLEGEIHTHQSSLETMRKEKVDLENSLEQEQESLFNTLGKRISKLEAEKRTMQSRLSQYESDEASPSSSSAQAC